jgi:hypothetical protein
VSDDPNATTLAQRHVNQQDIKRCTVDAFPGFALGCCQSGHLHHTGFGEDLREPRLDQDRILDQQYAQFGSRGREWSIAAQRHEAWRGPGRTVFMAS